MSIPPKVFPANNTIPLVVGYEYQLGTSDVWVQIWQIVNGVVYARGVPPTQADIREPTWKFDDLVGAYVVHSP